MGNTIGVSTRSVTYTVRGKVQRKESFLDSRSVVVALYSIKENAKEEHTRNNIQTMIDAIMELNPSM